MGLAVVIQLAVPLLLIGSIALIRQPSIKRWTITVLAYGMIILYLLISSRWDLSSLYLRALFPVLFLAACAWSFRKIRVPDKAPGTMNTILAWTINPALVLLMSGFLWFSLGGYKVPANAVDLVTPIGGTNVVLNGGASPFTNGHFRVRPQSFALDILGLNEFGASKSLFSSREELESYVIYGRAVFSPCDGRISVMVNDMPDLVPPNTDTQNPAGNHVLIECADFEILLAHLRENSITVAVGDTVRAGERIGEVGNSGNTSEPHLHIHAERGGEPGVILNGESVPITIEGRYLVRNNVLRDAGE